MTIDISNNNPRINYSVAGGVTQTSFAVPFEFFDDADVNVYVDEVLKTITTDYTVSGGSGSTGTIIMSVTGPATVSLTRDTVIERTTDFTAGVDINRAALNTQLDILTAIAADNKDYVERAIRVKDTEVAPNLILPSIAERADKLLSFDTEGAVSTQSAADLLTGAVLGANYTKASHTGNGSTVAFSTTSSAGSKNNIQVYIDGVYQNKDTFSISGATLTFSEAPPLNSAIEFIVGNAVASITGDADSITYTQGGTSSQQRTLEAKLQDFVSVKDFGAVGNGVADDTAAIQAAIDAAELVNSSVYFPAGTYKITAGLVVDNTIKLFGDTTEGSIISNTTNDIVAITIDSAGRNADRCVIENLRINHEAATKYAIVIGDAPFAYLQNVRIECNSTGFGGVLFGDEVTPNSAKDAYLGTMRHCRVWAFINTGIRVNSTGSLWHFDQCHVSSTVANTTGLLISKEGVRVTGGQYGSGSNGIPIHAYNYAGEAQGPTIDGCVMEDPAGAGDYGIVIDGDSPFVGTNIVNISANFSSLASLSTLVKFANSRYGRLMYPRIVNPTASSARLVEWDGGISNEVYVDYQAATADIAYTSGSNPIKFVTGVVSRANVSNVTTASGVTTEIVGHVTDMPTDFTTTHNGTAWNYHHAALSDDTATSFTPPSTMGIITIMNDDEPSTFGTVAYRTDTPLISLLSGGADLEVTTGALTGTTGNNLKVTVSVNSADGKIYIEARKGASNITALVQSTVYGV